MKTTSCIFVVIPLMAVSARPVLTLYNATRNGALVNVCLHDVDSNGNHVPQARLRGGIKTGDRLNLTMLRNVNNDKTDDQAGNPTRQVLSHGAAVIRRFH